MKLRNFAKIILFITAYLPLSIIMLVKYHHSSAVAMYTTGFILLVSFICCIIVLQILDETNKTEGSIYEIMTIEDQSQLSLNYLFTYIIPFITMTLDDISNLVSIGIFIFITLVIYVNSNLLYMNPFLNICGYSILKVNLKNEAGLYSYMLITKNKNKYIRIGQNVIIVPFNEDIFFLKKVIIS